MKIHQLPQGARFELDGVEYVKTGPMHATGPEGPRFIPKYMVLKPLDAAPTTHAPAAAAAPSREEVLRAFETFYARCRELVPPPHEGALQIARAAFLRSVDR